MLSMGTLHIHKLTKRFSSSRSCGCKLRYKVGITVVVLVSLVRAATAVVVIYWYPVAQAVWDRG